MTTTNSSRVGRRAAAMAAGVGTLAFTGAILAAGFGGAGDVRADALCDQMRAQYGPSWPCISVPTYTPPPTMDAPTTTPGAPGTSNGGAVIGGDAGPGPGTGNGKPIVGGQSTEQNRPGRTGVPAGPRTPAPATVTPNRPGQPANNEQTPGRTPEPAGAPVQQSDPSPSDQAFLSPASDDDGGSIPLPVWAIAGAAAVAAASPRARSLLSRGGSTRATVGPSRMVLIHDESSPTTYRFAMNVPEGGYTKINPDGSATVYDKDGNAIRQVARPWAFDAAGRPQKTWYTVDENGDLIQHVEPAENALYPILADPTDMETLQTASGQQNLTDMLNTPATGPYTPEQQEARSRMYAREDGLAVAQGTTDEGAPALVVGNPATGDIVATQTGPSPAEQAAMDNLQAASDSQNIDDTINTMGAGPYNDEQIAAQNRIAARNSGLAVAQTEAEDGTPLQVTGDPQTFEVNAEQTGLSPQQQQNLAQLENESRAGDALDQVTVQIQGPGLEEARARAAHRSTLRDNGYIVTSAINESNEHVDIVINRTTGREVVLRPGERMIISPETGQETAVDKATSSAFSRWLMSNDRDDTLNWTGRSIGAMGDGLGEAEKNAVPGTREKSFLGKSGTVARRFGWAATAVGEGAQVFGGEKTLEEGIKDGLGVTAFSVGGAFIGGMIGGPAAPITAAAGSFVGGLVWDMGKGFGFW